ncbi:MAG: hypothetical protein MMC33_004286 [Icmadophila ericetorum]|nr:hypothetical protein [Icmadophila ericetorum]
MKLLRTTGAALSLLVRDWGALMGSAAAGVLVPPLQALLSAARAVKEFLIQILKVQDLPWPAVNNLALVADLAAYIITAGNVAKLAVTGPVAAVVSGVRYAASCAQVLGAAILAGARVAPSVQATAMEAGSQVCEACRDFWGLDNTCLLGVRRRLDGLLGQLSKDDLKTCFA